MGRQAEPRGGAERSDEANRAGGWVSGMQTAQEAHLCPVALALERSPRHAVGRGRGPALCNSVLRWGIQREVRELHRTRTLHLAHLDPASHEMAPTIKQHGLWPRSRPDSPSGKSKEVTWPLFCDTGKLRVSPSEAGLRRLMPQQLH